MFTVSAYKYSLEGITGFEKIKYSAFNWSESVLWDGMRVKHLKKMPNGMYSETQGFDHSTSFSHRLKVGLCIGLVVPIIIAIALKNFHRFGLSSKITNESASVSATHTPLPVQPLKVLEKTSFHKVSVKKPIKDYSEATHPQELLQFALKKARLELKENDVIPTKDEWRYAVFDLLKQGEPTERGCQHCLSWGNVFVYNALTSTVDVEGQSKEISTIDAFSSLEVPLKPLWLHQNIQNISLDQFKNGNDVQVTKEVRAEFDKLVEALRSKYSGFMWIDDQWTVTQSTICPIDDPTLGAIPEAACFNEIFDVVVRKLIAKKGIEGDDLLDPYKLSEIVETALREILTPAFVDEEKNCIWLNSKVCLNFKAAPTFTHQDETHAHHFALHGTNELTSFAEKDYPFVTTEAFELTKLLKADDSEENIKEVTRLLKKLGEHCEKYYHPISKALYSEEPIEEVNECANYQRLPNHLLNHYLDKKYTIESPNVCGGSCLVASAVEIANGWMYERDKILSARSKIVEYIESNRKEFMCFVDYVETTPPPNTPNPQAWRQAPAFWIRSQFNTDASRNEAFDKRMTLIKQMSTDLMSPEIEALSHALKRPIHVITRSSPTFNIEDGNIMPHAKFGIGIESEKGPIMLIEDSPTYFKKLVPIKAQ